MKKSITQTNIDAAKPKSKVYEIRDTKLIGFLVRVQPSGKKSYYCEYKRGARVRIGLYQSISTKLAREQARKIIADYVQGGDPAAEKREKRQGINYGQFLQEYYYPWIKGNLKTAYEYRRTLERNCKDLMSIRLVEIKQRTIEKWRSRLLAKGKSPTNINRIYASLRASLSKAEEWDFIDEHPLRKMKPLKAAKSSIVRYLSQDEEKRLRQTIDDREARRRVDRQSANEWRRVRGYPLFPKIAEHEYTDHLKPLIILSLNTGMRQGETFQLKWSNVSFERKQLTVEAATAKSGKVRYIALNKEALRILTQWKDQSPEGAKYTFANRKGEPFDNVKKGWAKILKTADVDKFRWHDMRHHFASKLVMAGVSLNTVRELLGHSSYAMTLRYAHLSEGHKAEAVELLCL